MLNFNDPVSMEDGTIKNLSAMSGGGGGGSTYDFTTTDETVVGKWIDGRDIFRKIITRDTIATGTMIDFEVPALDRLLPMTCVMGQFPQSNVMGLTEVVNYPIANLSVGVLYGHGNGSLQYNGNAGVNVVIIAYYVKEN